MDYEEIKSEIPRLEDGKLDVIQWRKRKISASITDKYGDGLYEVLPKEDFAEIYRYSIRELQEYLSKFDKEPKDELTINHIKKQREYIELFEKTIVQILQPHT